MDTQPDLWDLLWQAMDLCRLGNGIWKEVGEAGMVEEISSPQPGGHKEHAPDNRPLQWALCFPSIKPFPLRMTQNCQKPFYQLEITFCVITVAAQYCWERLITKVRVPVGNGGVHFTRPAVRLAAPRQPKGNGQVVVLPAPRYGLPSQVVTRDQYIT